MHSLYQVSQKPAILSRPRPPSRPATLEQGDRFAARHPEMRIVRYLVPEFHVASHQPETGEFEQAERGSLESILPVLVESSRPDLLIAGREGYAGYVLELARTHRLPWALFVRGNPTVQILQGRHRGHRANELLDQCRQADLVLTVAEHLTEGLRRTGCTHAEMACERLLIASDIPPAREIVKDDVNGLLFRLGDAQDLAAKTLRMLRDPAARQQLGREARESMQTRSVDRAVERYLAKFAQLTGCCQVVV